ncbi:MAG: hypothetical protein P4L84_17955 [Isosphaeraceae bacterium]|nr:hypothetical protein [Isosphaeraceae bacterium]
MSSASEENAVLAAIQVASTDASARIQAAVQAATVEAQAQRDVAGIQAAAQQAIANIEASAQQAIANTVSTWQQTTANIAATAQTTVATTEAAAREAVANTEATAQTTVANTVSTWQQSVAATQAAAQESVATTAATAQTSIAATQAQADEQVASTHAQATINAAQSAAQGTITAAASSANATIQAATIDAGWHAGVASTQAQATIQSATLAANAQTESATTAANAQVSVANIDASWRTGVAQIGANAQVQAATIDAGWHAGVAQIEAAASNYRADQDLAGVNVHEAGETNRLNIKLAFAEEKWNELLPAIDSTLGIVDGAVSGGGGIGFGAVAPKGPTMGFGGVAATDDWQLGSYSRRLVRGPLHMGSGDVKTGGIGFASGSSVADAVAATQLPTIDTSGVLTPAQIQQQVNAAYARNDAKTASSALALIQDMSGRGFSSNSPILAALQVGLTGQNLRSSILAEQQIRLSAAQANAEQVLNSQKAVSDQFIAQEGALIEHERNEVTRTVGVLGAITQMIGSAIS